MRKKVKKMPKYAEGIPYAELGLFGMQQINNVQLSKQGVTAAGVASGALSGAATGAAVGSIVPGLGTAVGAGVGAVIGGVTSSIGTSHGYDANSNSTNFSDIYQPGSGIAAAVGHSKDYAMQKASMVQSANIAEQQTEDIRYKYYNKAAEGGVMRKPVDALVSKGELIYNPTTKKLSKVPGSKGKANNNDDVYAKLQEGDMVISNSPTMLMSNGKTPALNLEGLVDNDKNMKAKEAIIKKVVNWLEANRTKPQEYAMYEEGTPGVVKLGEDPIADKLMAELMKPVVPKITGKSRKGLKFLNKMFDTASDYAPVLAALAKNTDYDVEQAYINPVKYLPTGVSIAPLKRSAEESLAIGRYNLARINPNTGAGMAYGLQAATNRAKALADAYTWQQDTQNKLIAQNVGIYNDLSAREAQARHTAAVETSQNAAAAQLMKDQAMKDAYEFKTGRRNDRWKLSMLKPLFNYAVDDNIWRNFKIV